MTCYIVLADWLHENYNQIAKSKGWKIKKECTGSLETCPKENQEVMLELARRIIDKFEQ